MARTVGQMVAEATAAVPAVGVGDRQRRMQEDPNTLVVDMRDSATKHLEKGGHNTMKTNLRSIKSWRMLVALALAAVMLTAHPAQASGRTCPAPGTGLPGALNMLHDPTMATIPMARDAAQGNAGMFNAVDKSGC